MSVMGKLKSSFVLKKYSEEEKLVELSLNFGYKEYDPIREKYSYKPLRYYTGIRIVKGEWDDVNRVPFNSGKLKELLNLEQTAHDIYNYLSTSSEKITPESLRGELDKVLKGKTEAKSVIGIADYIEKVILPATSKRSTRTLKNYTQLAKKIRDFEGMNKLVITVDNLDEDLYLKFVDYLSSVLGRINSVWGELKNFKAVLNEIRRKHKVNIFNPTNELAAGDKVSAQTEDKVYFTFDTIQRIIDFEPSSDKLKNTKLILLTLLFSGCRYSDVFKIRAENEFNEGGVNFKYARFIDQKTGKDIIVPILAPLEKAFRENNNESAYRISDVKFNKYVKELCELAELSEDVKLSFTNAAGKKEYEVKPFYKFVSSHVGRRSFITNLINFIPITILTKITGHSIKDNSIIFSYNKISLLDNAVLFVKELKRVSESNPDDFPIRLV